MTTLSQGGAAILLLIEFQKLLIMINGRNNHHVLEVLGGCTDKGDAADVYLFDDVLLWGPAGNGGLKGIEVHDDQVDFGNLILRQLLPVGEHVAPTENAAKDLGMEGFDTASQNGRIAREGLNGNGLYAEVVDKLIGATRRVDGHTLAVEGSNDVFKSVFIEDRNEG